MLTIRPEAPGDAASIHDVNLQAFGGAEEANLVDALRTQANPFISLVAVEDDAVVGHISFTAVTIGGEACKAVGLAPMSVLPDRQRHEIGTQLVWQGLQECKRHGQEIVVVVGHASYYPRFGFVPGRTKGLTCEFPVPDNVFMVLELRPGALDGKTGMVRYHPAFGGGEAS
jgi:putative acetyltransferase